MKEPGRHSRESCYLWSVDRVSVKHIEVVPLALHGQPVETQPDRGGWPGRGGGRGWGGRWPKGGVTSQHTILIHTVFRSPQNLEASNPLPIPFRHTPDHTGQTTAPSFECKDQTQAGPPTFSWPWWCRSQLDHCLFPGYSWGAVALFPGPGEAWERG